MISSIYFYLRVFACFLCITSQLSLFSQELINTIDPATISAVLKDEIPDLQINSIRIISSGWENMVAVVNDDWIFRFPRSESFFNTLDQEIWLLNSLKGRVDLPIPFYEYIGSSYAFVGYKMIKGDSLEEETYLTLSDEVRQNIAESLALFLSQMHAAIPVDQALEHGFEKYRAPLEWIESTLLGALPSPDIELIVAEALKHVKEHSYGNERLVLAHNDLHGENFAFDFTENKVAGVFDFSDAMIGDYSIEFGKLFEIHSDLAKRTAEVYMRLNHIENPILDAAADYILRRATYILRGRESGNLQHEKGLLRMLKDFVPIWNDLKK